MKISYYDNNCSMVAFQQVLPDRDETEIVAACMQAGFTEWLGMLPTQIEKAATLLGLEYTKADLIKYKPTHCSQDRRKSLTLGQALAATRNEVCLITVTGHIIASNHGIPIDPNMRVRGARRRVLHLYVLHNATIERRNPSAISNDPEIIFVHDVRHDTRKSSSRRAIYEAVYEYLGDPALPVRFSEIKKLGYTRSMLRRHVQCGDVIIHRP